MGMKTTLCHSCIHGGQLVERCHSPELTERGVIPKKAWSSTLLLSNAAAVAKSKGIKDFSPLHYIAVVAATLNGQCSFYIAE